MTSSFPAPQTLTRRWPDLWLLGLLLLALNLPTLAGDPLISLVFQPDALKRGEVWRLLTFPFIHVSWYHLLLDGAAFLLLYRSLQQPILAIRLLYVIAAGTMSLCMAWLLDPALAQRGLCGLSGVDHGLMAISSLEMIASGPPRTAERRLGLIALAVLLLKSAFEAVTGSALLGFLHFGLMGHPVAVVHAGGVLGGILAFGLAHLSSSVGSSGRSERDPARCLAIRSMFEPFS
jgi:rhomboid family GlyGly-CTERM serine protease